MQGCPGKIEGKQKLEAHRRTIVGRKEKGQPMRRRLPLPKNEM
ncbi:hypothetical protein HMPREF1548_03460 [Clostridium sp. KLE 1755]|nr:hypothetical protein HMPREF1548_03460 [Clostridium sp. KLE 1755]